MGNITSDAKPGNCGYYGVKTRGGYYEAEIKVVKKIKKIGIFLLPQEAAAAYDDCVRRDKLVGFLPLNFPTHFERDQNDKSRPT